MRLRLLLQCAVGGVAAALCLLALARAVDDCNAASFQRVLSPAVLSIPARAVWLNRESITWPGISDSGNFRLYFSAQGRIQALTGQRVTGADGALTLRPATREISPEISERFRYVGSGAHLNVDTASLHRIPALLRDQLVLVQQDADGHILNATQLQHPGALDDLYSKALELGDLGVTVTKDGRHSQTHFKLWAPTARQVALCLYRNSSDPAQTAIPMRWSADTGVWTLSRPADLSGQYYHYLVDVFVPGIGVIRNRVTDPYSVSLNADSRRSFITSLDDAHTKPQNWDSDAAPATVKAATDMNVVELHVRDFSINDATVTAPHRGKYLAFTEARSNGMQHLAALAQAGITDIHLLPTFDFASVPEQHCRRPVIDPQWPGDSMKQQVAVVAVADSDCFNWGYDPLHYSAPEGSYATDADDGARRIIEFRQMVAALHRTGLRVGMDVVYNHTFAAGQQEKSVLDRIVPGYYQRLNADGAVEHSTCCDNTATENHMMGKLLIDSALLWAQQYHIDSFRFDLMAHQPRAVMEALQQRLLRSTGRQIQLLGEGWNFGEVANGARFVQASQLSLNGSGIGTFNDRIRDAVRGGSAGDSGDELVQHKGYINGLGGVEQMRAADMLRAALAGSVRDYPLTTVDGRVTLLKNMDYHGQPVGYVSAPTEVVNYVENHDNQTLFDINAYKLPVDTTKTDRALIQMTGVAIVAFSQGVAYFHAGVDILRSKSMDGNSFNSGDWFNRLDWRYQDNYFASGLPPEVDNGKNYSIIKPLLENAQIKPGPEQIRLSRDLFRDLIRIRSSSSLFHLTTAAEIQQRLVFENVGPDQIPEILAAHLDGNHYPGARFSAIVYLINVGSATRQIVLSQEKNKNYVLHPVQNSVTAADQRIRQEARYDPSDGRFTLPAHSAVVFVEP